jgi:acyl-CoA synthetase (AMP-forming)/AMP-acid ligase II
MALTTPLTNKLHTVRTLASAGVIRPTRPDKLVKVGLALNRFGPTPAAGYTASAIRFPHDQAIIDELGTLTFEDVHKRTNALAHSMADAGVVEGDGVAIMCRNHRWFIDATVACSKLGAHALYLNTAFAGPQITDVVKREAPRAIVFDEEFTELVRDAAVRRKRFIGWHDGPDALDDPTLESMIEEGDPSDVVPPSEKGRVVILTSGTTGTPKGASRSQPETLDPAAALLSKIPLHARERTMIAAPMFHSWGFAHFTLGLGLSSTVVLRRKFDPEGTLAAVAQHRCTALVVVPVMLSRILELDQEVIDRYDTSCLRVIAVSGSALPGPLAERVMDAFGETLYNLYGSTEVAWATIATPEDMRAAPGTSGRPPRGTILKIYDDQGKELAPGETGRIFVGNEMLFEGYTGGGSKDEIDGLMATGDVGHVDEAGRLHVEGRDDEMIVSGGENVFPAEVEDLLARHDKVKEVAVIGVDDDEWGQRLKAYVVAKDGGSLSEDDVKKHVKSNLAGYKVPRDVEFIDELPRNATGKVVKRDLQERETEKAES